MKSKCPYVFISLVPMSASKDGLTNRSKFKSCQTKSGTLQKRKTAVIDITVIESCLDTFPNKATSLDRFLIKDIMLIMKLMKITSGGKNISI